MVSAMGADTKVDSWVALGTTGAPPSAFVDEIGTVHETGRRLALAWAVHGPDGWLLPGSGGCRITRTTRAGGAIVESGIKVPSGQVIHRCYVAQVSGRSVAIVEVDNASAIPVAVALRLAPSPLLEAAPMAERTGAVTASGDVVRYNGLPYIYLDRPAAPEATASGPAGLPPDGYPVVIPVTHRSCVRMVIVGIDAEPLGAVPPAPAQVESGWMQRLSSGTRVRSDDGVIDELWRSALVSLMVATDIEHVPRPLGVDGSEWTFVDEARVAGALATTGFADESGLVLGSLLEHLQGGPLGPSPDDEAVVLGALGRWFRATADTSLVSTFPVELLGAADRILRQSSSRARRLWSRRRPTTPRSTVSATATRSILDLAAMLSAIDEAEAASILIGRLDRRGPIERGTGEPSVPAESADPVDDVERFERIRHRNGHFPTSVDAACRRNHGSGDDPRRAADVVDAVRSVLVDDTGAARGSRTLDVVPFLVPRWRGTNFDVHDLPTALGSLSFGVRWHGPRPALLWELEPGPGVSAGDVMLTSRGLDVTWIGSGVSGDALLTEPEIDGIM